MNNTMKTTFTFLFSFIYSIFIYSQDAEILVENINYKVKSNKLYCKIYEDIKINNRTGEKYGALFIPFSKGDKVSLDYIQIEDMEGNIIRKIKNKEIKDRSYISQISLYEDDFVKECEISNNTFPYRVVRSYSLEISKFLSITSLDYSNYSIPIRDGKLSVELDLDYAINYKYENVEMQPIDTLNNRLTYSWSYSYQPLSLKREINQSVNHTTGPQIEIVPLTINYGVKGSQDTWANFGKWISDLNQDKTELPDSEKQIISELVRESKTVKEKIQKLYKYLQESTRYINVSINLGGLQTYPASYVVANKYGDCKALTNYMLSMLKFLDINSYYTLVNAGSKIRDIDPNFVSQEFNHVILTVPLDSDTIYLECTAKNNPFGYLGTFTQGRDALLVDGEQSHLIRLPELTSQDVLCRREMNIDLNTALLNLKSEERGEKYESSNYLVNELNKSRQEKYLRNNILTGSFDLLNVELIPETQKPEITFVSDCKIQNYSKKYGNNLLLSPFPINMTVYEAPNTRKLDVQLDYPENYEDILIMNLGDLKIKELPLDIKKESKYGSYEISYKQEDNKLVQTKKILINRGRYAIAEYDSFYQFISFIKETESKNIIVETL